MEKQNELYATLMARQGASTNTEFARLLGVPETSWRHYRRGRRVIGYRLALAVQDAYPALKPLLRQALAEHQAERRQGGDCGEAG